MQKLFNPESIAVIGLSSNPKNIAKLILENLIRWGYKGRILGVHPAPSEEHVDGIKLYAKVSDLPIVPDLAVAMIPARTIPAAIEACGEFGIRWMAVPSGGFNELGGEEGPRLAEAVRQAAKKHGVHFVGPNGIAVANTQNGLCLPFVPSYRPPRGGMSIIAQSGGIGLMLWNYLTDDNIGMAKFASIGNKLDLDEVDFLEYFGRDPDTKIIAMYLESIERGRALVEAAGRIDKPILVLKSNTTAAGRKAALSHTAALSNNDEVADSAFERAGMIRVKDLSEFISMAKAFALPPMRGKRLMMMSPAGGAAVMMADHCERLGFEFADPGRAFYDSLQAYTNAGVIRFGNPLDMGDIYNMDLYAHIYYSVMHSPNVDGAVYVSQWPQMPRGEDVFYKLFHTDLSKEVTGTMLSSGKPIAVCLFGLSKTISLIKQRIQFPIFDRVDELMHALREQCRFYSRERGVPATLTRPAGLDLEAARAFLRGRAPGGVGEEAMELLGKLGLPVPAGGLARTEDEAVAIASRVGYEVVAKVASKDALHKSEVGGVALGLRDEGELRSAFARLRENLARARPGAAFEGATVARMARPGHDLFVGGSRDPSFGPIVYFGYGGIYVEVFRDVQSSLCPCPREEIVEKLRRLRCAPALEGARGRSRGDLEGFVDVVERVSWIMAELPEVEELDLNPTRMPEDGSPVQVLDVRLRTGTPAP
jgi:acetate---CoA ligase (ADP-forming)